MPKKVSPAANLPITDDEAKAHCRVTFNDDDDLIHQLIHAATAELENKLQRVLCESTMQITLDRFPTGGIRLTHPPILQVQSIVYWSKEGTQLTLSASDYVVDTVSEPGWIFPAPGLTWPETQDRINAVTVLYKAGYLLGSTAQQQRDAVPRDSRAWLLIRVATLYENRESVTFASAPFNITALDSLWMPHRVIEA